MLLLLDVVFVTLVYEMIGLTVNQHNKILSATVFLHFSLILNIRPNKKYLHIHNLRENRSA